MTEGVSAMAPSAASPRALVSWFWRSGPRCAAASMTAALPSAVARLTRTSLAARARARTTTRLRWCAPPPSTSIQSHMVSKLALPEASTASLVHAFFAESSCCCSCSCGSASEKRKRKTLLQDSTIAAKPLNLQNHVPPGSLHYPSEHGSAFGTSGNPTRPGSYALTPGSHPSMHQSSYGSTPGSHMNMHPMHVAGAGFSPGVDGSGSYSQRDSAWSSAGGTGQGSMYGVYQSGSAPSGPQSNMSGARLVAPQSQNE